MTRKTLVRRWLAIAVIGLVYLILAASAPAQVRTPCSETIDKFCKDVIPGNGRIMKCLNDHREDQSIACKDWVEDQQKSARDLMAVCPEEIAKLCRATQPDAVSIYYCLLDNYSALLQDCRSKLGEIRDRLK